MSRHQLQIALGRQVSSQASPIQCNFQAHRCFVALTPLVPQRSPSQWLLDHLMAADSIILLLLMFPLEQYP